MNIKIIIYFFIFLTNTFLHAGIDEKKLVQLPSQDILANRFEQKGLSHFAQKTGIITNLCNKTIAYGIVLQEINVAVEQYAQNMHGTPLLKNFCKKRN